MDCRFIVQVGMVCRFTVQVGMDCRFTVQTEMECRFKVQIDMECRFTVQIGMECRLVVRYVPIAGSRFMVQSPSPVPCRPSKKFARALSPSSRPSSSTFTEDEARQPKLGMLFDSLEHADAYQRKNCAILGGHNRQLSVRCILFIHACSAGL